jgi:hypothetical protein
MKSDARYSSRNRSPAHLRAPSRTSTLSFYESTLFSIEIAIIFSTEAPGTIFFQIIINVTSIHCLGYLFPIPWKKGPTKIQGRSAPQADIYQGERRLTLRVWIHLRNLLQVR